MLTFKDLKKLKLGGQKDASALAGVSLATLATNPLFQAVAPEVATLLASIFAAGAGGAHLANRTFDKWISKDILESSMDINSAKPPLEIRPGHPAEGILIGYCTDTGKPLIIPYAFLMRHALICGQSGVGKTVLGRLIILQQIMNGGGLLFVDGKMNQEEIELMHAFCAWAGRLHDLRVISPGSPDDSNTYNPVLDGDPDEVAARILSLIPSTENNPGADHYKQSANQGVATLVAALKASGYAYNFIDLTILLLNQKALQWLENVTPRDSKAKTNLSLFLDQYRIPGKDGKVSIDMKRLKETFGGVGGRLFMFGTGNFGKVTNTYDPEVRLFDAINNNHIVYAALPTMGKAEAAQNFGKMLVGDFRTAVSWTQKLPDDKKPWPPFIGFFDEAGSYVSMAWARILEQARSAQICVIPAIQTFANLDAVSPELREMVIGNTWTKIFFKIGTPETAEAAAEIIAKEQAVVMGLTVSDSASQSSAAAPTQPGGGESEGGNTGYSERQDEVYKVSPAELMGMGMGEIVVTYGGSDVYHAMVPMLAPSKELVAEVGPYIPNRRRERQVKGLHLFSKANTYLSTSGANQGGGNEQHSDDE